MRKSKIKDYIIVKQGENEYLYGRVTGDIRFPNGHLILTSKISEINEEEGIAVTINQTHYKLGNKLTQEEFIQQVKEKYQDSKMINYILSPLNLEENSQEMQKEEG